MLLRIVFRSVDRAHIQNLFPVRVRESLIGERQHAKYH